MAGQILKELKAHAPFTIFGTITGIAIMVFSLNLPYKVSNNIFYVLHPLHVFLSALVTAAMYKLHTCPSIGVNCIKGKCNFWALTIIGYVGSVGIATVSDPAVACISKLFIVQLKGDYREYTMWSGLERS